MSSRSLWAIIAFLFAVSVARADISGTTTWGNPPPPSGSPFLNYEVADFAIGTGGNGDTGHAFKLSPIDAPDGSTIILSITYAHSVTTLTGASITDSYGVTWSNPVCTADDGTHYKTSLFVQNVGTGHNGQDLISVGVGSSNIQPFRYVTADWENLQNPAADGSSCKDAVTPTSGGVLDPGSFTPTTTNTAHVIWNDTDLNLCCSSAQVPTGWTAASGFTLHESSKIQQYVSNTEMAFGGEFELVASQSTNSSIDPIVTATGETAGIGDVFNSVSVALAVNASGSATPVSTIHVLKRQDEFINGWAGTPSSMQLQVPFFGNLRVATVGWDDWTSVTVSSSDGCVWHLAVAGTLLGDPIWYAQNCSPDSNDIVTFSGAPGHQANAWQIWDIQNAAASSFQNGSGNTTGPGGETCGTTNTNAPTITPTGATTGIVIAGVTNSTGPGYSVTSPTGAIYDGMTYTGQSDGSWATSGNNLGHVYYTSKSVQNWDWTQSVSTACDYDSAAFN